MNKYKITIKEQGASQLAIDIDTIIDSILQSPMAKDDEEFKKKLFSLNELSKWN